jgi:hypothetical protein
MDFFLQFDNTLHRAVELPHREVRRPDGCIERLVQEFICQFCAEDVPLALTRRRIIS